MVIQCLYIFSTSWLLSQSPVLVWFLIETLLFAQRLSGFELVQATHSSFALTKSHHGYSEWLHRVETGIHCLQWSAQPVLQSWVGPNLAWPIPNFHTEIECVWSDWSILQQLKALSIAKKKSKNAKTYVCFSSFLRVRFCSPHSCPLQKKICDVKRKSKSVANYLMLPSSASSTKLVTNVSSRMLVNNNNELNNLAR